VLPHSRSIDTPGEIEEERRLFYVGMTRAKKTLVLTRAVYRRSYGEDRLRASLPSRFVAEIPRDLIETAAGSQAEPGESRRYEPDPEYSQDFSYGRGGRTPYGRTSATGRGASGGAGAKNPLIGKRVRHLKFGIGTIIEVDGDGDDRRITVSFQDYGPKKLLERYANLQLA
jgi:DNA helicase-2/ATP-dependent DNA helicase PcrA